MSNSVIHYEEMVQVALLSVVRDILQDIAEHGLPGEHHFYITFNTEHPDVHIPPYLKKRYPDDMTIVLQNQFWDLFIDEDHFEITLSFNRKREHLYVPFQALLGFFDPSVDFGLHFHAEDDEEEGFQDLADRVVPDRDMDFQPPAGDNTDNVITLDAFRKET